MGLKMARKQESQGVHSWRVCHNITDCYLGYAEAQLVIEGDSVAGGEVKGGGDQELASGAEAAAFFEAR